MITEWSIKAMSDDSRKEAWVIWCLIIAECHPLGEECTTTDVEQEAESIKFTFMLVHDNHTILLKLTARFNS